MVFQREAPQMELFQALGKKRSDEHRQTRCCCDHFATRAHQTEEPIDRTEEPIDVRFLRFTSNIGLSEEDQQREVVVEPSLWLWWASRLVSGFVEFFRLRVSFSVLENSNPVSLQSDSLIHSVFTRAV